MNPSSETLQNRAIVLLRQTKLKFIVMKKIVFIFVLVMSVLAVKAQDTKTPNPSDSKSTVTTPATSVRVADLPKSITDYIAKDHPGYTVKEASSVTGKNGLNYQVIIAKGTETESLLFDKDGTFLKKLSGKAGSHDTKDSKDTKKY